MYSYLIFLPFPQLLQDPPTSLFTQLHVFYPSLFQTKTKQKKPQPTKQETKNENQKINKKQVKQKILPKPKPYGICFVWSTTPKHKACPIVWLTEKPRDASVEKSDSHFPLSVLGPSLA